MLNAEQIQSNWDKHIKIVNHYITGERKQKVLDMLNAMSDIYVMAPASGKTWYHNAFAGGYVDHVNRVVQYTVKQSKMYEEMGGTIDYTDRSLFILQKFGIQVDQKEFLGIRCHDGVFDKANEAYFFSNVESSRQKTALISVLHTGDFLASKVEYDIWKNNGGTSKPKVSTAKSTAGRPVKASEGLSNLIKNI